MRLALKHVATKGGGSWCNQLCSKYPSNVRCKTDGDSDSGIFGSLIEFIIGKKRKLNDDEIKLAKKYFGDKIDYSKVRIMEKPNLGQRIFSPGEGGGAASGHTIYMPGYGGFYNYDKALFLHEMTHVYQYETHNWGDFQWKKLIGSKSKYILDVNKSFHDYSFEQQARIVQSYHLDRNIDTGKPLTDEDKKIMKNMLQVEGLLKE